MKTKEEIHRLAEGNFSHALGAIIYNLSDHKYRSYLNKLMHERIDLGLDTYGSDAWSEVTEDDYPLIDLAEELADAVVYFCIGLANNKRMSILLPDENSNPRPRNPLPGKSADW